MLARTALWTAAAAMVLTVVLGALDTLGVGLATPDPLPDDVSQRILHRFLTAEESFLLWGRWVDLVNGIGFGALLVAVSALVVNAGQRMILAAGAALAVAGDAIYLSKLAGFETARVGLDNGLGDSFAAGNVFRFAVNFTAHYVWISGLFLLAIGFLLMARSAVDRRAQVLAVGVAAALAVAGIVHPISGDPALIVFNASFTVFVVAFVAWVTWTATSIKGASAVTTG